MIVSEKGLWKKVLPVYGQSTLMVMGVSLAVSFAVETLGWKQLCLPIQPFSIVGAGLSILLVFRNNEAYGRYWEARTLWGQVIAHSRSFCRAALTVTRPDASKVGAHSGEEVPAELEELRRDLVYRAVAFLGALTSSLRGESASDLDFDALKPFLAADEIAVLREQKHGPAALLHTQSERLADAWRADFLHPQHLALLDEHLTALTVSAGGCEKIARTPIPPAYGFLARRIVWGFVALLPFALVADLGWRTVLVAPLMAFLFGALQRFGEEVQHPFEHKHDGLPLDSTVRQFEIEGRQRLGESRLPEPLRDEEGVLL